MASIVNIGHNDDVQTIILKCNENFKNLAKQSNDDNTEVINNADGLSDVGTKLTQLKDELVEFVESVGSQIHNINQSLQDLRAEVNEALDALPKIFSNSIEYSDAFGNVVEKTISIPASAPHGSAKSVFVTSNDPYVKIKVMGNGNGRKIYIRIDASDAKNSPVNINWLAIY